MVVEINVFFKFTSWYSTFPEAKWLPLPQVLYLANNSNSPFQRKGAGLQKFSDLIKIVFSKDNLTIQHMEAIKKSYKVSASTQHCKVEVGEDLLF